MILHAPEKNYLFLKQHKIAAVLLYIIFQIGKTPNISDLLRNKIFDLIINILSRKNSISKTEFTDGKFIRKGALSLGLNLITDEKVAEMVIENLANN